MTTNTTPTPTEVEELAREVRLQAWLSDPRQFATWILSRFVRREEHERLRAEVREWLCGTCRFVYPGPPQPGLRCVVCPRCGGSTAPRHAVEMQELRAELKGQRCDGSGRLLVLNKENGITYTYWCPLSGCPACKPDATPPNIGYRRCCGSDQDKSHEEWCDNKPDATPKGDGGATIGYGWHMNYGDGSRDREVVSEAGERDCNATPAGEDQSPAFRPDAPVRGCPRHTPYWCYPCDDCSEILRRKHEAEAAAPVHVSLTPERMSLLEHHCSDADFATIGKLRDESYAAGYQAGRDDAARLNIQQVSHVVELGPATLRALVAALLSDHQRRDVSGVEWADALLTHLHEREMK